MCPGRIWNWAKKNKKRMAKWKKEMEKEKEKGKRRSSPTTPSVNLCLGLAIYSHELVRQMVRTTIALEGGQNRTRIWDNDKFAFFLKKSYRECNLCCTAKKKKWIAKKVAVLFKTIKQLIYSFFFFSCSLGFGHTYTTTCTVHKSFDAWESH